MIKYISSLTKILILPLLVMGCSKNVDAKPAKVEALTENIDFKRTAMELGDYVCVTADAPVDIIIESGATSPSQVDIQPASLNIKYSLEGSKIRLKGVSASKLAVTVNGDYSKPTFVFVNQPQPREWSELPSNTIRFKAGVTNIDNYPITRDNTTIFLEEGAIVKGCFTGKNVKNVKILGYGVIDGREIKRGIRFEKSADITISGPIVMSSNGWSVSFFECNNLNIDNIKILSSQVYSDGIDLLAVQNAVIDNVFVRNEDDCIVIKTKKYTFAGNSENILIKNCVLWSGHRGNALEIGWETDGDYIRNIRYTNCDIIRKGTSENKFKRAAISIHHTGNSTISDVIYKDIRIESVDENLIWIGYTTSESWGSGNGKIDNVRFENVSYTKGPAAPIIFSGSTENRITNIVFKNFNYLGRKITSLESPPFAVKDTQIVFEP